MIRLLGIGVSLAALLGTIWFCSMHGAAVTEKTKQTPLPQYYPVSTQPVVTEPEASAQLPYAGIFARRLISYDGPFLENEMEEELIGVAALEVCNLGDAVVEYAEIVVEQPYRQLRFEATYIPPGSSVLVLEKDAQRYDTGLITDFACTKVICMKPEDVGESVHVETDGFCSLKVTNLTEEDISCVRVFYKQYYEAEDLLLGGVTFCLVVPNLESGQSQAFSPYHFAAELSRIVAVAVEP